MKEFNLELAKAGHPVCTRNGHDARIVCFDKKGNEYSIVALVSSNNREEMYSYTLEGQFTATKIPHKLDLMMVSTKREGWINVYKDYKVDKKVFTTKDDAIDNIVSSNGYIATIKIKWEE